MGRLHFDPCFMVFFGARFFVLWPSARVEKTHFHPRGVAKMERVQFEAPAGGPFRRYFIGVFCVRDPEG